jgi:hypothetical protein
MLASSRAYVCTYARARMWPTGQIRGLIMLAASRCACLELIKVQARQNNLIPTEKERVETQRTRKILYYVLHPKIQFVMGIGREKSMFRSEDNLHFEKFGDGKVTSILRRTEYYSIVCVYTFAVYDS